MKKLLALVLFFLGASFAAGWYVFVILRWKPTPTDWLTVMVVAAIIQYVLYMANETKPREKNNGNQ